jgi:hypothetical protein
LPGKIIRQGSALAKQATWRPQAGAPLLMIFARLINSEGVPYVDE